MFRHEVTFCGPVRFMNPAPGHTATPPTTGLPSEVTFEAPVRFAGGTVDLTAIEELRTRVEKLEATVDEMVACQPSDPRGDLARAEKRFSENASGVKRKREAWEN